MRVFAIFMSFVPVIDMLLDILIELNFLNDLAIVSLMLDHSKIRKLPKMSFLAILSTWVSLVGLILHLLILLIVPNDSVSSVRSVCSVGSVCSMRSVCSLLNDVELTLVRYSRA